MRQKFCILKCSEAYDQFETLATTRNNHILLRCKKDLFILVLSLLFLSCISLVSEAVAESRPNGVGVFCPETKVCTRSNYCYNDKNSTTGYWFEGSYIEQYRPAGSDIVHYDSDEYLLKGTSQIYFCDDKSPAGFCLYLDRKKLTVSDDTYIRQCELVNNKAQLFILMKNDMALSLSGNKL